MSELQTEILTVDPLEPAAHTIARAAAVIRAGGLVAFPTETVYGLGADALNPAAVRRIFAAKERPAYDPIIVHVAEVDELADLVRFVPPLAYRLAEAFWPGPLTMVLPHSDIVPEEITAGGPTVAVRCPAHPVARALIRAAGTPLGAPSANRFSRTSPTTAAHVLADLAGRIEMILDGGSAQVGVESTVLDLTSRPPVILRPGGVPREEIARVAGPIPLIQRPAVPSEGPDLGRPLPSPGMLDRHYAPQTPLWLFALGKASDQDKLRRRLRTAWEEARQRGERVGLLLAVEDRAAFGDIPDEEGIEIIGSLGEPATAAHNLYRALRQLDGAGFDLILARDFPPAGLGLALQDRLRRAAERVIEV